MTEKTKIQLNPNRISQIPLHTYECDFMFVVNDEIFKTSKIISDLISPIICQQHINDATTDTFTIHTVNQGDFSHVLNLVNFQPNSIPDSEIPFFHFLKYLRKVRYYFIRYFRLHKLCGTR